MSQVKEQLEKDLCWDDFSIQPHNNNSYLLVLICEEEKGRFALYDILSTHHYSFVFTIEADKTYEFHLNFLNLDYSKSFKTGLTEAKFPSLQFLRQGSVKYITTGFFKDDGISCEYYEPIPFFSIQRSARTQSTS
jgi:hypothetical protein